MDVPPSKRTKRGCQLTLAESFSLEEGASALMAGNSDSLAVKRKVDESSTPPLFSSPSSSTSPTPSPTPSPSSSATPYLSPSTILRSTTGQESSENSTVQPQHTETEHVSSESAEEGDDECISAGSESVVCVPEDSKSFSRQKPITKEKHMHEVKGAKGKGAPREGMKQTKITSHAVSKPKPKHTYTSPSSTNRPDLPASLGAPLCDLCFGPSAYPILPPLKSSAAHSVLFHPRLKPGRPPLPFPDAFRDVWDEHHVRMPCSEQSLYPVVMEGGRKQLLKRWDLIQQSLRKSISNSYDLEEAILVYNSTYSKRWDFRGLHNYFSEVCTEEECEAFFHSVLPKMIDLALSLPQIVTHAVPLLRKQQNFSISMSQHQIACLLANAFLCTFPRRNAQQGGRSMYASFPTINFSGLFRCQMASKLRCILHYFTRVTSTMPEGVVTFTRQAVPSPPQWGNCQAELSSLRLDSVGTIETNGKGMLQVDFANRSVGGGVLGQGCVQEEIRFLVCPELILARLFTEMLDSNESLIITGVEQFSYYKGYARSFKWGGPFNDDTIRDSWGRRQTVVVAIDALNFHDHDSQFKPGLIRRELDKAYCGFMTTETTACRQNMAVATGNWGCGAFGGDARLKGLLQMIAAAVCGRDVMYFTFGNRELQQDLYCMHKYLKQHHVKVCKIWTILVRYFEEVVKKKGSQSLYQFIYDALGREPGNHGDGTGGGRREEKTEEGEGRRKEEEGRREEGEGRIVAGKRDTSSEAEGSSPGSNSTVEYSLHGDSPI